MEEARRRGPLSDLHVLELSTVLAGPYCAMVLADLGAQVIKVEPPDGDPTRGYGPPWVTAEPLAPDASAERVAAYYLSVNRNKRSLRLDLRQRAGVAVVERLISRSDVLIENFRPGGLERLGLTETRLHELNPKLVQLSITGYGRTGPDAEKPGFDFIAQAVGGLMSITGAAVTEGGQPTKVGVAITRRGDRAFRRGRGARCAALGGGTADRRVVARGHAGDAHQPGPERVRDRRIALAARQRAPEHRALRDVRHGRSARLPWRWAVSGSGRDCVRRWVWKRWRPMNGSRPTTLRVRNRAVLRPLLAERFAARNSSEWLAALDAAGVPCGPVNDVLAAFAQPQARARGMEVTIEHPSLGPIRQVGPAVQALGHAGVNPLRTPTARRARRRDPGRARLRPGGDRRAALLGHHLATACVTAVGTVPRLT